MDILLEELSFGLKESEQMIRISVRLLAAMALGAVVGLDRQRAGKAAGLRTHMIVAIGSALFVAVPLIYGMPLEDVSRVIQGIATGVGFVGAGSIVKLKEDGEIEGLTTAAGIWLTSAVGVAAGLGRLGAAVYSVILALLILSVFSRISERVEHKQDAPAPSE